MKALVFLDHDITIRHFLHSGALSNTLAQGNSALVTPGSTAKKRVSLNEGNLAPFGRILVLPQSPLRRKQWNRLFHVNRLRWRSGEQSAYLRHSTRLAVGKLHSLQYSLLALPLFFTFLWCWSMLVLLFNRNQALAELLAREDPDVVVHPTVMDGLYVNDLIAECRKRRLPLVLIMNSWDNISTLRYIHKAPDWLLVWGKQTYDHAIKYLQMPADRVIRFGAAQFDCYRHPKRSRQKEFRTTYGLDERKRVILYAGSSKGLREVEHLDYLDNAIASGEIKDAVVIYRPHPWGDGGEGGQFILERNWKHVLIDITMRRYLSMVQNGFRGFYFSDYSDTVEVLTFVDCVVSPLSTIILEGAMLGKPVICFLPMEEESMHFKRAAPLEHFRPMYESSDFVVVRSISDLVLGITEVLKRSEEVSTQFKMRQAAEFFIDNFETAYSERLLYFLRGISCPK